jgi:hypothetical protein
MYVEQPGEIASGHKFHLKINVFVLALAMTNKNYETLGGLEGLQIPNRG